MKLTREIRYINASLAAFQSVSYASVLVSIISAFSFELNLQLFLICLAMMILFANFSLTYLLNVANDAINDLIDEIDADMERDLRNWGNQ